MKLELDKYAHLDSPIHRWDPRYKLVALFALIFAFSFVQDLRLLPAMLVTTGLLYAASRLPLSYLLNRLRLPGYFLLALASLLPFLAGNTVIFRLGPLTLRQEGILALILVATRFVSIITIGLVLFGTAPFLTTIKAMRSLGLASVLADMTFLTYRYIYEFGDRLATMQTAMRLRGFQGNRLSRRNLRLLASLAGTLLVRSYEQSERVYKAMILRGYGQAPRRRDQFKARRRDAIALCTVLLIATGFVVAEILFEQGGA